jgi:nicotinamide mononucleotide transporter
MHAFDNSSSELLSASLHWLFTHYIEVLATITGLIYLVYSVRGQILLWLFGLISSLLYVFVFYKAKIYALMCINLYYVIISIYGWVHWSFPGKNNKKELPVSRLNRSMSMYLLVVSFFLFAFIGFVLKKFTNSDIVIWDAFITAFSITATWMLARKIMEHWLVWIVVDLIAVVLYLYKELYPTVLLFIFYAALAIVGYKEWKKLWKNQEQISGV